MARCRKDRHALSLAEEARIVGSLIPRRAWRNGRVDWVHSEWGSAQDGRPGGPENPASTREGFRGLRAVGPAKQVLEPTGIQAMSQEQVLRLGMIQLPERGACALQPSTAVVTSRRAYPELSG